MKFAALVPIYNHGATIARVVDALDALGLECLVVDDGSDDSTRESLRMLAGRRARVRVEHLPRNGGKGAAIAHGIARLDADGFTHALALDADDQHDAAAIPAFLAAARAHPEALLLGAPVFGPDAPRSRLYGRRISRFWVHVETLSRAIDDPLCGYRCYPVRATHALLSSRRVGTRMDFDPEVAVRLAWSGVPVLNIPTRVVYPTDGVSHFRMGRDNAAISWMHTRLVLEMLLRVPRLLGSGAVRRIEAVELEHDAIRPLARAHVRATAREHEHAHAQASSTATARAEVRD